MAKPGTSDLAGSVTVGLTAEMDQFKAGMRESAQAVREVKNETTSAAAAVVPALNKISAAGTAGMNELNAAQQRYLERLERQNAAMRGGKAAVEELRAAQLGLAGNEKVTALLETFRQLEATQRKNAEAAVAASVAVKAHAESEEDATARIRASVAASLEKTAALNKEIEASRAAAAAAREAGGRSAPAGTDRIDASLQNRSLQETADRVAEVNRALGSIGRGASSQKELQAQTDKLVSLWGQGRISAEQYAAAVKQLDLSEAQLNKTSAEAAARADAFIARLKDQAATAGKSAKELLEYRAAQLGVTSQAAPLIEQIEKAEKGMHGFSLATSGSRRELGVLAREIASGNFSGASRSFSIFAEQSGLMATLMSPAAMAVGVLTASIGALAYAYVKGHGEQKQFTDALILTGNAAGQTASGLHDISVDATRFGGSLSSAKAAVLELASGGKFAGDQIAAIATSATLMEVATGRAIGKTIAEFEKLTKDPVRALTELNEQYHYLSVSQYQHIADLANEGHATEAATQAIRDHAEMLNTRATEILSQLGVIEQGWNDIKIAIQVAGDALLGLGRKSSLAEQIAQLRAEKVSAQQGMQDTLSEFGPSVVSAWGSDKQARLDRLIKQQQEEAATTAAAAADARLSQAAIKASEALDAQSISLDKTAAKTVALAKLKAEFTALYQGNDGKFNAKLEGVSFDEKDSPISGGLYDKLRKDIEDKYKEKAPSGVDNILNAQIKAIQGQMQEAERNLRTSLQNNKALYDVGLVNTQDYLQADYEARRAALDKEMVLAQQQEAIAGRKKNLSALEEAKNQQQKIRDEQLQNEQKYANDTRSLMEKNARDVQAYIESLNASYNTRADAIRNLIAGAGLGDAARDELNRLNQVQQEFDRASETLRKSREKGEAHGGISQSQYDQEMAALQTSLEDRLQLERDYSEQTKKVQQDGWVGASRFMQNYADQAANVAGQVESLFNSAARGMEDAFASFVTTGKLNFSDLAKSVIADIARMQARAAISGLFNFAISAAASYFGGSGSGESSAANTADYWQSTAGGSVGFKANALGGIYESPSLSAYSGQVVSRPTLFAFAKGAGLMGEAGPEGIFPLKRGPNGALGVQAYGAGSPLSVATTVNIYSDGSSDSSTKSQSDASAKELGDIVNQMITQRFLVEQRQNGVIWKIRNGVAS